MARLFVVTQESLATARKEVAKVAHYSFEPFGGIGVMGVSIQPMAQINYLWPVWVGCPAEWPLPSDSFHC